MSRRELTLAVGALALAGAAFAPHLYQCSRPVTDLAVVEGGTWRVIAGQRLVIHRIPKYCYSPGLGAIIGLDTQPNARGFTTASAVASALQAEAEGQADRFITVTLAFHAGYRWPWQAPDLYFYVWHYNEARAHWEFFAYSPRGAKPPAADSVTAQKRAA